MLQATRKRSCPGRARATTSRRSFAIRAARACWKYHKITAQRLYDDLQGLPAKIDHVDALVADGVIGGVGGFARLGPEDRENALRRVEQSHAELFEVLVRHTYNGYYGHPTVVARLGLDPSPLHPRGHRTETADGPDLARVTARGPIYRRT